MKYYILFTHTIYNIGGGQLLTLRKARFLKEKGYQVIVIYKIQRGPFLLEKDFADILSFYVPDFLKVFNTVNNKKRKAIENLLGKYIRNADYNNSLIESHDGDIAVWAEYFARRWNIPHVLYMISEFDLTKSNFFPYANFYKYKLKRNELWGCNSEGLRLCFNSQMREYEDNYVNVSFSSSEIPDYSKPAIKFPIVVDQNSFVISTISRIDKGYILPLLSKIEDYCKCHSDYNVYFIIVGDTVFEEVRNNLNKRIDIINSSYSNLHVVSTGFCTPGKDFFKYTDLFIGMGTAIISAISQGCISLTIDPFTNLTGGIFGMEMQNFAFSKNEFDVNDKLEEIMSYSKTKRDEISQVSIKFFEENYSLNSTWEKQCQLIKKMPLDYRFYDFNKALFYKPIDLLLTFLSKVYHIIK